MSDNPQENRSWLVHSAWAMAPATFLLELFGFLAASFVSSLFGFAPTPEGTFVSSMVVICCISYQLGKRCAEQEATKPRKRLWGSAALVSVLYAAFVYLFFSAAKDLIRKELEKSQELIASLKEQGISQLDDTMMTVIGVELAIFVAIFQFVVHGVVFSLGANSAKKTA